LDTKDVKTIGQEFSLNLTTARKYIKMPEEKIASLDFPTTYKKVRTVMDEYINIIYKMLYDEIEPVIIMKYIIRKGYTGNWGTLNCYVTLLAKNNFNLRFRQDWGYDYDYPDNLIIIKRNDLFKYIITKNPTTIKDDVIEQNFEIIKEKYAVVAVLKEVYDDFYETLMGKNPDKLDTFIAKHDESIFKCFVDGIVNDITPVKNAISYTESNGFVEGNNNKFKLIKRILYGRANLDYLFKKCYLAFQTQKDDFELSKFLEKDASL